MPDREIRASLPGHPVPESAASAGVLRVDGRVTHTLELTLTDLAAMPRRTLVDTFACVEGWAVPDLSWEGVPLEDVLDLAEVEPEARWVRASAGDYGAPLSLEVAREGLLALNLGGQPLPVAHGGPVRLVVPGQACFTSIKWLDHLECRDEPGPDTARAMAERRLSGRTTA
jgi:DMSO/TMAO reductase YedYZ molybdopterin-dependent catalytic subunit